jgi:hypothetical protein
MEQLPDHATSDAASRHIRSCYCKRTGPHRSYVCAEDIEMLTKFLPGEANMMRSLTRHGHRCEDNIKVNLKGIGCDVEEMD